jgi:hypothetical protein
MKKKNGKKLTLSKETLRELQLSKLKEAVGGATNTYKCDSCGSPLSTCPIVL